MTMNNIVAITDRFRAPQVALIRRMNSDCNEDEFNQFMHVSATLGLDPLKKQIYAFVFSKDKPDKRRMSIIVGIDGFRSVAKRSGCSLPEVIAIYVFMMANAGARTQTNASERRKTLRYRYRYRRR